MSNIHYCYRSIRIKELMIFVIGGNKHIRLDGLCRTKQKTSGSPANSDGTNFICNRFCISNGRPKRCFYVF